MEDKNLPAVKTLQVEYVCEDMTEEQIEFYTENILNPSALVNTPDIMQQLNGIELAISQLKEAQDQWKEIIQASMERHGIKKVENDYLTITKIEPTEAVGLDQDKLKKEFAEVYIQCTKKTAKKGYLKISYK